jgi:hypothetical protein
MKILDSDETVLKVYLGEQDDIYLEFENRTFCFTPLEANQLSMLLEKLCNRTEYFKGLRKE